MSNSKTFKGPQGTLQQLSWTVTGLIQIRLCQIQRLLKDHKGHSYSYHGLLLGSYRLGYVKFKGFSMTTRDTPTIVINYFRDSTDKVMSIQGLFKDYKGHFYNCHKLFQGLYRQGYVKFKDFSRTTKDTRTIVINYYWAYTAKVMSNSRTLQGQLEDLKVLRRSPDIFYNVKIGQGQLLLIIKHIF